MSTGTNWLTQSLRDVNEVGVIVEAHVQGCKAARVAWKQRPGTDVRAILELEPVMATVALAKAVILPLLECPTNDTAFDVCARDVFVASGRLLALVRAAALVPSGTKGEGSLHTSDEHPVLALQAAVFAVLHADYQMALRLEQLAELFPTPSELDLLVSFSSITPPLSTSSDLARERLDRLLVDPSGRDFWMNCFGPKTLLVPWDQFYQSLAAHVTTQTDNRTQAAIRSYVDPTEDGFVSPYDFSLFLRWFGPLEKSVRHVLEPLKLRVLAGPISAYESACLLEGRAVGSYLMRMSRTKRSCFAVAVVVEERGNCKVRHSLLSSGKQLGSVSVKQGNGRKLTFKSLIGFCAAQQDRLINPVAPIVPSLQQLRDDSSESSEELIYSEGNSDCNEEAEEEEVLGDCVICMEIPAATVFLECGHICCCLGCSAMVTRCPMCRSVIVRTVPILLPDGMPLVIDDEDIARVDAEASMLAGQLAGGKPRPVLMTPPPPSPLDSGMDTLESVIGRMNL